MAFEATSEIQATTEIQGTIEETEKPYFSNESLLITAESIPTKNLQFFSSSAHALMEIVRQHVKKKIALYKSY